MSYATETAVLALPKPPTTDELIVSIETAKREYASSKSSAMKSAASAYIVWYWAESEYADPAMREWLDGEIYKANADIEKHNKDIDRLKDRAKECADGKINDPLTDEAKADLLAKHKWKASDWAKVKQVKIEARSGASQFTRVAKYVFGFTKPSEASLVSRYAKVLEYVEQHKDELAGIVTEDAIFNLLDAAGGFEAALEKVRNPEGSNDNGLRAATLEKIKAAVKRTDTGNEITFDPKYEQDGYVFLVGRTTATGVMVCGELAINDNEAEELLFKVDGDIIGKAKPTVDFVARVASIGELVREGREGNVDDTAGTGRKFKVARTYTLNELGDKTQMVVSARYTDATTVVHAFPKAGVEIGRVEPGQIALLDAKEAAATVKQFRDQGRRLLLGVEVEQGDVDVPVRWQISTELKGGKTNQTVEWTSLYKEAHCPWDKRHFDAKCSITLTAQQVRQVYHEYLHEWGKTKPDDKSVNKPLTIAFDGLEFAVGHPVYEHKSYAFGQKQGSPVSLQFRPRDIVDLFKKLVELNVQHCTFHGDADGMLAVSWDDDVGDYTVYIPVVERGALSKACLQKMKPKK